MHLYFNFLYCDPIKIRTEGSSDVTGGSIDSVHQSFPVGFATLHRPKPIPNLSHFRVNGCLPIYLFYLFLVTSDKIAITTKSEVACTEYPLPKQNKSNFIGVQN